MHGIVFDIKRYAIHDGPGIRTTVFLKGCPLRCAWCHNPESWQYGIETISSRDGETTVGRSMTVDEVVAILQRDTAFYDESGGGVTFSGGEPLVQIKFLTEVLYRCRAMDLHCAIDTSGCIPRADLLAAAKLTNLVLFDIKHMSDDKHLEYTKVDTGLIRDNLYALSNTQTEVELRYPVIPGINNSIEDIQSLCEFVAALPRRLPIRFLAYHRGAMDKHRRFGLTPTLSDTQEPTHKEMAHLRSVAKDHGMEVRE
jgi:pyruvate formate lyase activating enzyme